MKLSDINEELLRKYAEGALSKEEEEAFDIMCMHNEEALQKLQQFAKANLLKSFTSQYADIGRQVFSEHRTGNLQFSLSNKFGDVVESSKRALILIEHLVNTLIGEAAIPQISVLRSDDPETIQKKAIELLTGKLHVTFTRKLDKISFSLEFDSDDNLIVFKDVKLPNGPASKLIIRDSNSSSILKEILVDTESSSFSIPFLILQQDVSLLFQAD